MFSLNGFSISSRLLDIKILFGLEKRVFKPVHKPTILQCVVSVFTCLHRRRDLLRRPDGAGARGGAGGAAAA